MPAEDGFTTAITEWGCGTTQRLVFRIICRNGGYTTEPNIRKELLEMYNVVSLNTTKKHLKVMEAGNLIRKEGKPGAANIVRLAYEEPECFQYLCDLISRSHRDPDIAKDIREFFEKTNASGDSITKRMVANNMRPIERYIDYTLQKLFGRKRGDGTPEPWFLTEDQKTDVYSRACESPSLFAVGSQHTDLLFATMIWALTDNEKYQNQQLDETRDETVLRCLLYAANAIDYMVYDVARVDGRYVHLP